MTALSACSKQDILENSVTDTTSPDKSTTGALQYRYIVVMKQEQGPAAANIAQNSSVRQFFPDKCIAKINLNENDKFTGDITGYVTTLTSEQVAVLQRSDKVAIIEQDQTIMLDDIKPISTGTRNSLKFEAPPMPQPEIKEQPASTTIPTDVRINGEIVPWGVIRMGAVGSNGKGKTAWIIDSGIDFNHPDLSVDKQLSKSFLSATDGGLYDSYIDETGHGTAVAGIIGAKANGKGIVGVAPGANLVSLKVVNKKGVFLVSNLIRALQWVQKYAKPGDVVNISLQANESPAIDHFVTDLAAKRIYVTIGAGNSATDCSTKSPQRANAPNIYTVSAMNNDNTFWKGSNYGDPVDFTAPGTRILTTEIGGTYNYVSGTSFSAPHLAGLLLINSGQVLIDGYVRNDPDTRKDGIAHQ